MADWLSLHPISYTAGTALAFLGSLAGLSVGHLIGDILLQTDADACGKGYPDDGRLAAGVPPWTGWPACLRHVATYLCAQAATLAVVLLVIPLSLPGILAALAVSGSSHAVIDRRRLVQQIIAVKRCSGWPQAPFWIDQTLHATAVLIAAVAAARTTTLTGAAAITAAGLLLIVNTLRVERRRGRRIAGAARPQTHADPTEATR